MQTLETKIQQAKATIDNIAKSQRQNKVFAYINNLPQELQYRRHELILYYYDKKWAKQY